jgi:DNA-binding MarR family transcriptional regulator
VSNDRVGLLVERLSHLVREDLRAVATRHELPLAQLEVLRFLAVANRFSDTVSGLVEYVGATKGTLSQCVNALERKG